MIPSVDLILGTIERALTVAVLPAAGNASAKEEASIGILFIGWLRDVVDHAVDAERASYNDCRAALADVLTLLPSRAASKAVAGEIRAYLAEPAVETAAAVREATRRAKALLARSLRAAREDTSHAAKTIRRRLADLAGRELEREIAFGRATGIDPDGAKSASIAEVVADWKRRQGP